MPLSREATVSRKERTARSPASRDKARIARSLREAEVRLPERRVQLETVVAQPTERCEIFDDELNALLEAVTG